MTYRDRDSPDPQACPLLGLAGDSRTHYTFPHPGHRCHADRSPGKVDLARQSSYCLSANFVSCGLYQAREAARQRAARTAGPSPVSGMPAVIHVARAGDTLARIASAYGVTLEQLAMANGLAPNAAIRDGQRLVIPLPPSPAGGRTGASS